MNNQIQERLALFAENFQAIRSDFIWHNDMAKRLAALCYVMEGKPIDVEAIRDSHKIMKEELGMFSGFRGNMAIYIAATLSLREDPRQLLADTIYVHDLLKQEKFWSGDFLAVTAFEIAANAHRTDYERLASRTREFYDAMRANNRIHMGQDDYIFAAMLAMSGIDVETGAAKARRLYLHLKGEVSGFISRGSVLNLAQMLVLGGSTEQCVANMLQLNKALRQHKVRLDKTYTLPALGVLGLLDIPHDTLAHDLIDARDYLRSQKGFGAFTVTIHEIMLYAVSAVMSAYVGDAGNSNLRAGITTSVTNLIIAQQVAMMAAISAATAGAAAGGGGC